MRYKVDFPDSVKEVAEKYVEIYHKNNDVRMSHKKNMDTFSQLGKDIPIFKQIADCIETIMWYQDQVEDM